MQTECSVSSTLIYSSISKASKLSTDTQQRQQSRRCLPCCLSAALRLLYCSFTAAVLLLSCCLTATVERRQQVRGNRPRRCFLKGQHAQTCTPYALCLMPYALCLMPYALHSRGSSPAAASSKANAHKRADALLAKQVKQQEVTQRYTGTGAEESSSSKAAVKQQ